MKIAPILRCLQPLLVHVLEKYANVTQTFVRLVYFTPNLHNLDQNVMKSNMEFLQMRLDFTNFVITGPSTNTNSVMNAVGGANGGATGKDVSLRGNCFTDVFTVSSSSVPTLCGTLTGDHRKLPKIFLGIPIATFWGSIQ